MTDIAPGWYKDPADPTTQRYWDGEGWIGHALPADAPAPPGPPPPDGGPEAPPAPAPDNGAAPADGPRSTAGGEPSGAVGGEPPGEPSGAVGGEPSGAVGAPTPSGPAGQGPTSGEAGLGVPPGHPATQPPPGWPYHAYRYPPRLLPAPRPHGLTLATPGARLVARLIDIGVLIVLNVLANGLFVWQYAKEITPTVQEWERYFSQQGADVPENSPRAGYLQIVIILITAVLWLAYEVPAVANTGQTLGKRLLGIKVVRVEAPGPVGFARSLRRWNTLGLPTLLWPCCGIGFVLQFVDVGYLLVDRPLLQALHDKSARTVVVRVDPVPHGRAEPEEPAGPDASGEPSQPRTDEHIDNPGGTA